MAASLGSITVGSILIDFSSMPPVTTTVTMPPPADASTVFCRAASCASIIRCCIICACCISAFRSGPSAIVLLQVVDDRVLPGAAELIVEHLAGGVVEGLLLAPLAVLVHLALLDLQQGLGRSRFGLADDDLHRQIASE